MKLKLLPFLLINSSVELWISFRYLLFVFISVTERSRIHRMAWIERDLKDQLLPIPLTWAGTPLNQVDQCPIQTSYKHWQGWASTTSMSNLFHCLNACTVENFCWISTLNLLPFSLKPFLLVLSLHVPVNIFLHVSCGLPAGTGRVQLSHPKTFTFPDWAIPVLLAFPHSRGAPSLTTLVVSSGLTLSVRVLPVLCLPQGRMQHRRWGSHQSRWADSPWTCWPWMLEKTCCSTVVSLKR